MADHWRHGGRRDVDILRTVADQSCGACFSYTSCTLMPPPTLALKTWMNAFLKTFPMVVRTASFGLWNEPEIGTSVAKRSFGWFEDPADGFEQAFPEQLDRILDILLQGKNLHVIEDRLHVPAEISAGSFQFRRACKSAPLEIEKGIRTRHLIQPDQRNVRHLGLEVKGGRVRRDRN